MLQRLVKANRCSLLTLPPSPPHPALLHNVREHDNATGSVLPHHPPEVRRGVWQRTLRRNVRIFLLVTLQVNREEAFVGQ